MYDFSDGVTAFYLNRKEPMVPSNEQLRRMRKVFRVLKWWRGLEFSGEELAAQGFALLAIVMMGVLIQ